MTQIIELKNSDICIKLLPHIGGRIVFLSKNGLQNILESNSTLWDDKNKPEVSAFADFKAYNGHIVWLGPQSEWWIHQDINENRKQEASVWPPDPFLIYGEYKIENKTENSIVLISPESPVWGVQMRKEIVINDDGSIYQNVEVRNIRTTSIAWDIWFNTRLHGMNKAYVPINNDTNNLRVIVNQLGNSQDMPYCTESGFFNFKPSQPDSDFNDRSVKAFVYPNANYMVGFNTKHAISILFEKHSKQEIHPEQALVEIYNYTHENISSALLELEYHSPYKTLKPNETMSAWQVWNVYDYNGNNNKNDHIDFIKKVIEE
jgi:hypothetical protein